MGTDEVAATHPVVAAAEAETKAAADPAALTQADIHHLSGATVSKLAREGRLEHLGMRCGVWKTF
jgi:hypothetical protein